MLYINKYKQIFFVGKERWLSKRCTDFYYHSIEDKNDPLIQPEAIEVPFYVCTLPIHEILLRFASAVDDYVYDCEAFPWSPYPTPSCIADLSLWESIFEFGVHPCFFMFMYVC